MILKFVVKNEQNNKTLFVFLLCKGENEGVPRGPGDVARSHVPHRQRLPEFPGPATDVARQYGAKTHGTRQPLRGRYVHGAFCGPSRRIFGNDGAVATFTSRYARNILLDELCV